MFYNVSLKRKIFFRFFFSPISEKRFNKSYVKNVKERKETSFISFSKSSPKVKNGGRGEEQEEEAEKEEENIVENENEKYSFDILMDNIKYKSCDYNWGKRRELQNKILIHLRNFSINESIATLVVCSKYHFFDLRFCKKILDFIFPKSFFLNNTHMYIIIKLIQRNQLGENKKSCFVNTDPVKKIKEIDTYEMKCIQENLTWKQKVYEDIKEHIFFPIKKEKKQQEKGEKEKEEEEEEEENEKEKEKEDGEREGNGSLILFEKNDNSTTFNELTYIEEQDNEKKKVMEIERDIEMERERYTNFIQKKYIENKEISSDFDFDFHKSEILNTPLYEKMNKDQDMKELTAKIKTILFHNYNSIQFYLKHNIYCSLYLLIYLLTENMISIEKFAYNIYNINEEFKSIIFNSEKNIFSIYDDCDDNNNYNNNNYNNNNINKGKTIINNFLKEEQKNESLIDLYFSAHFHVIKRMFQKNEYSIKDEHFLEKIEYNFLLDKDIYIHKKLYIDIFHLFFDICLHIKTSICSLRLFYLNIVVYEIFKLLIDETERVDTSVGAIIDDTSVDTEVNTEVDIDVNTEVDIERNTKGNKNIKLNYDILKNVKINTILQYEQEPNFLYYLFSIIFYLKNTSGNKNKYKVCFLDSDIKNCYHTYVLFLKSLKNYSLFDLLIKSDFVKEKKKDDNFETKEIENKWDTYFNNNTERNVFFSFFVFDITFNIIHYIKKIDICTLVTIFTYLGKLDFKNEYVIDILRKQLFTSFIKRSFYKFNDDKKYFFYFIKYVLAELDLSPPYFFYLISFLEVSVFHNMFSLFDKEESVRKISKNLYDGINSVINQNRNVKRKCEKKRILWEQKIPHNGKSNFYQNDYNYLKEKEIKQKLKMIQNTLYDFLFF